MPVGTGTLYVARQATEEEEEREAAVADEPNLPPPPPPTKKSRTDKMSGPKGDLRLERAGLNVTQRQESLVVQYLTLGGYRERNQRFDTPVLAASGVHAGPGQLSFGWSSRHRADLTLAFKKTPTQPALLFIHNYHEHGVHYKGHEHSQCPKYNSSSSSSGSRRKKRKFNAFFAHMDVDEEDLEQQQHSRSQELGQLLFDRDTLKMDHFKRGLAEAWSLVSPANVLFHYDTSTACDFFHGRLLPGLANAEAVSSSLETLLADFEKTTTAGHNRCKVFLPTPRYNDPTAQDLTFDQLKRDICEGREHGFVTITGGEEKKFGQQHGSTTRSHRLFWILCSKLRLRPARFVGVHQRTNCPCSRLGSRGSSARTVFAKSTGPHTQQHHLSL